MNETWRDVVGYEGLYQVSDHGRVKSLNYNKTGQERLMRLITDKKGYLRVTLWKDGKQKMYQTHRIVAQAFIDNPDNKPCIDHINAIKTDNRVENLRWVTCKENCNNPITKERCRISNIGKVTRIVFCENTIFTSITQCAKYYGINRKTMNDWLTGKNPMPVDFQEKGLKYYIEEEK